MTSSRGVLLNSNKDRLTSATSAAAPLWQIDLRRELQAIIYLYNIVDLCVVVRKTSGHCFAVHHTIRKAFANESKRGPMLSQQHRYAAAIENTHDITPLCVGWAQGQIIRQGFSRLLTARCEGCTFATDGCKRPPPDDPLDATQKLANMRRAGAPHQKGWINGLPRAPAEGKL